jgi:hypothetical protein
VGSMPRARGVNWPGFWREIVLMKPGRLPKMD